MGSERTSLLRDVDKKELDFLVSVDGKPWFAVETKLSDENVSAATQYFRGKLKIPFVYQVLRKSGVHRLSQGFELSQRIVFWPG